MEQNDLNDMQQYKYNNNNNNNNNIGCRSDQRRSHIGPNNSDILSVLD